MGKQPLSVDQVLQQALAHHQAGRLQEAALLYRAMLRAWPLHPDANHNLGVLTMQLNQPAAELGHLKAALDANPAQAQYWLSYIAALIQAGQNDAARQVLAKGRQRGLQGEAVEALARRLGWQTGAVPAGPQAQGADAGPTPAEISQALTLFSQGGYAELEPMARALTLRFPLHGFGWQMLGVVLRHMGRNEEALMPMQTAVALLPGDFEVHYNFANTLQELERLPEAEASYRRALEIKPDFVDALNNLAWILNAQGKSMMALTIIDQSLQSRETWEAKGLFVQCVRRLRFMHDSSDIRVAIVRALSEPWGRPSDLARTGINFLKLNRNIGEGVARAAEAWPRRLSAKDLFAPAGLATVAADPLLCVLLDSALICDIELERFLTMARRTMLDAATGATASDGEGDTVLRFYAALARQCFTNEYVFDWTHDETDQARMLRDSLVAALKAEAQIPLLWPVAVAAYFPLHTLPFADRMLDRPWPNEVTAVLVQQIREPREERQYAAIIPRLTPIEDEVSLLVQRQYEENPYPRWVKAMPAGKPTNIDRYLRQLFPLATFQLLGKSGGPDILIAGCGTGQHPIETAQQFEGARVLAVDLSLTSLCYAKRKTQAQGLNSIEYAQADLIKLGTLDRRFDIIQSSGVLHHLADPMAGWRVLLSLLRPGGFMFLGLYSDLARREIVRAQDFITEHGYAATAGDIRRCRQDLMNIDASAGFGATLKLEDFFSTSACRDLLFHVQEHRMTLAGINTFLRDNDLQFLGFHVGHDVLQIYRLRFPDDRAATNLDYWHDFENENPDTFIGMYQFWVQKAA